MRWVVIGSGPAGVAAARALADAGRIVTVLDAGDEIEPGQMDVFETLARTEPDAWPAECVRSARSAFPVDLRRVPLKPAYGSLFPYALEDADLTVSRENADTLPSLALGGLSNSWGASMAPFRQCDIEDWPITLADLAPHYRAVLRFIPMAAVDDALTEILPLYTDNPGALRRGAQANVLLNHMWRHDAALRHAGFRFGASRLAVTTAPQCTDRCRHCGLCLYGCPYGSIYNSAHTLRQLMREKRVEYRGKVYVDHLTQTGSEVTVHLHDRGSPDTRSQLDASRVFVACGAVSSTRLMLASIDHPPCLRRLRDSQYFVMPVVTFRAVPVSVATQGNTLAQAFLELDDLIGSRRSVHMQLYGYNDLMLSALTRHLRSDPGRLERVSRSILGRLMVIQGYLHSDDSPALTLTTDNRVVRLVGERDDIGTDNVRRVKRQLMAAARELGMMPVPGLAQLGHPGKGNHLGGSFPMRRDPGPFETDTLGRVPGWDRVHLVDASVLPSIPATTITLSVMANAHRIASAAAVIAA